MLVGRNVHEIPGVMGKGRLAIAGARRNQPVPTATSYAWFVWRKADRSGRCVISDPGWRPDAPFTRR